MAARSLDMPLSRSPSYCLRFLIVPVRLPGIAISFRSSGPSSGSVRGVRAAESTAHVGDEALHVAVSSLFEVLLGERQAVGAIDPEGGELIRSIYLEQSGALRIDLGRVVRSHGLARIVDGAVHACSFPRLAEAEPASDTGRPGPAPGAVSP